MALLGTLELLIKRYLKLPAFRVFCLIGRFISPLTDRPVRREKVSRILIFQGGGIGDLIRTFPMLRILKKELPHAALSVLSPFDDRVFSLFPDRDTIAEYLIFDPAGKQKSFFSKLSLMRSLKRKSYDLILCPQTGLGMIELSVLSFVAGAPYRIGYDMNGSGFLFTTKVALKEDTSIYEQHIELLHSLSSPSGPHRHEMEIPFISIPGEDLAAARSFLKAHDISEKDIIVTMSPIVMADRDNRSPQHDRPLAGLRVWPEEKYIDLINEITRSYRVKVIILGDRISQGSLSEFLNRNENSRTVSAINKTTLGQSAALISMSRVFIGNDTGLLHIALALKMPCIGIFGSTSPEQVLPSVDFFIAVRAGIDCSPCFVHQPAADFKCDREVQCLRSISVDDVMTAVKQLLTT
jgi:heptosyltransferase-2